MMTEQQIFNEIQDLPLTDRLALLEKISRNVRESLERKAENRATQKKDFSIKPLSLQHCENLDFDNIGKLLEATEGDFHK